MSSHIQKPCVVLEATLSDSKKKYPDKVNALLNAWEYVTNYIANTAENIQSLIEWVNEHTLVLVLRGEWPKLAPATKTHLNVTLKKCASLLAQQQHPAAKRCQTLIEFVQNPWGKPALDKILNGQLNPEHEEEEFCCQEKGELLKMRLKILCEDRCEDIAVNLAAACVRSLRRNDRLRSLSEPGHVHYMIDVYIVLLYKLKRTHDIVAQLKLMDLKDGLELMQRLSGEKPTKYGTARVWRNSSKAAELVAQYLVTTGMVRPLAEVSSETLEQILNSWAILHAKSKDVVATLPGIIRKLIEPAESAQHIYIFCGVLFKHFGDTMKPLVIELYIRALTTDMNELETQKSKSNKEKVQETAKRLSQEFLKLADCVNDSIGIARECVLTAFSLHPTRACYDRIRELAIACGKISREDHSVDKIKIENDLEIKTEKEDVIEPKKEEPTNINETEFTLIESFVNVPLKNEEPTAIEKARTKESVVESSVNDKSKCHPEEKLPSVKKEETIENKSDFQIKQEPNQVRLVSTTNVEKSQHALILIKGDAVTGSADYDEKAVPNQVLDSEKLGISPQLCDDLAVVLNSQRYHVLTWWLNWKELSELCERYLENAEEMRNTNRELKYLNIDYSQFKDHPYDHDERDSPFYGIEKGYEQWDDSDYSESESASQSRTVKTTSVRRSLDDSSDTDSENIVIRPVKRGRPRKVPRLESSESEYDMRHRKPKQRFRKVLKVLSSSDSDTNTQDSQTSSLGSDGFKRDSKKLLKKTCNGTKKSIPLQVTKRRPRKTKLTVDSVSHFHLLVNENMRPNGDDGVGDNSNNDIMTLFSADMDENKRETIKGAAAFNAAQLIITEKRSDPAVIKSLRMFRPSGKKLTQINEKTTNNIIIKKENTIDENSININSMNENTINENTNGMQTKFAPMLSTLNLNPKIALRRVDEMDKKFAEQQKKKGSPVTAGDLSNELRNIQKTIPFSTNKNSLTGISRPRVGKILTKQRKNSNSKSMKGDIEKSKLKEILTNSVPGMRSMEFSVLPRVQSTVHVVQLTRNISQSPNSTASGNTPPRSRSNIQLPGTPSSGGHDSGVGMSPAGQTPPPPTRSLSLQDVGEEANQPPDTSPGIVDSTNTPTLDTTDGTRTVALAVLANQRMGTNQSPKKSPSPATNNATEQQLVLCKPDGTYHLVSPSIVTGQRGILSLQNFEDGNIGFARHVPVASVAGTEVKSTQSQAIRNTGLPKFQHAFGKTICTLSTESTAVPSSSAADTQETPAPPAGAATNVPRTPVKSTNSPNISKAVQTAVQSSNITNIPNLQVSTGTRQILNLVQSAVTNANANAMSATGQTLQLVPNSTPGVIYTHKIPVTIAGANPGTQLISIPAAISNNRSPVQVKLNIIRTAPFRSATGAIQAVLASRIQQQPQQQQQQQPQQQSQPQQQQTVRPADTLMNATMEIPNQVSSSTLEQLREFESVLEQVKERSTSQSSATDTSTVQTQTQTVSNSASTKQQQSQQVSVNTLTQQLLMSTQSHSSAVEFPSNGSTVTFQQQEVYPQKVALMYTNQNNGSATPKVVNSTPVVVVTSYCQPAASPALSVTSQSSSSPCVTPAPTPVSSTGKTPPQTTPKSTKKSAPKTIKVNTQNTAKTAPIPKPQQKPQEDPETTQRIYAILGQYAEQLRNSPDLNNKPAPRRRSNPPTNPNQSSKRKKSSSGKSKSSSGQQTSEPSPSADDMGRTMGSSEDSSGGGGGTGSITGSGSTILHVQDSPAGFSANEETLAGSNNNSQSSANDNATLGNISETKSTNTTSDSNDGVEVNVKRRNLIFAEPNTGQARAVIVQEALQPTSVGEAFASVTGKMTTGTAVLVSGTNFMLPMNFVKSGQQITVVSGGSKLLAAVPAVRTSTGASGAVSNAFVLQSLLSQANKVIQQNQPKQMKLPQQSHVVIPQAAGVVRFANEDNSNDKPDNKLDGTVTKVPTTAIGLFQHSGVITSNPNIGQRIFNTSTVKLPTKVENTPQQVVCLTAPTAIKDTETQKTATTIALAFTTNNDINSSVTRIQKESKETETAANTEDEKMMTPKTIKTKEEQTIIGVDKTLVQCNPIAGVSQSVNRKIKSPVSTIIPATTSSSNLDPTTQFLVSGGQSSSDSQESASSTIQTSTLESSSMDGAKIENEVLCGNARLQEAWEPERKESPDTPWRYVPTTNALGMQPIKVYSRDVENSETVHNSVLQIINKGQGIEMSSSGVLQSKKYYHTINNSVESFQKFPVKALTRTTQPNNARTIAEQENQQRINDRKQQLIERELRLQKSLSEECEDLGVDEPSTSDLFPEADLLFDTNHSPSFDHSSQEASCSQPLSLEMNCSGTTSLSGIKSYTGATTTNSFFKSLDSVSSGSRDTSPMVTTATMTIPTPEPKKKTPVQRRTTKPKELQGRRNKRISDGLQTMDGVDSAATVAKQLRLSLVENLSQDDASNSNSDLSRLSPAIENDSAKETHSQKSANGSKDRDNIPNLDSSNTTGHIGSSITSGVVRRNSGVVNNVSSTASSGEDDEGLTLLDDSTANVTIPSPLSPIAGPLLMTHRYYANNKKRPLTVKSRLNDFFGVDTRTTSSSWESPSSERTRSSSDEEDDEIDEGDDSSISEALGSSHFEITGSSNMGNGLQDVVKNVPSVKVTPVDHATYSAKRKATVTRKPIMNHKDVNTGIVSKSSSTVTPNSTSKKPRTTAVVAVATTTTLTTMSENDSLSPAPSSDKIYEVSPSDDEMSTATIMSSSGGILDVSVDHCSTAAARRSSLRGHVKKGCACCNGSPERPKSKKLISVKPQHVDHNNSIKVKRTKQQNQQQAKQLAKKR